MRGRRVQTHRVVCPTCSYSFYFTTGLRKTKRKVPPPLNCVEAKRILREEGRLADPDPLMFCDTLRRTFEATTGSRLL